ncbi:MAG: hypothetical protein HY770_08050, partial [Chitinivibrionia bacterium]|nr:hypothetical protein [Chitinivibrionia bacterium]
MQGGSQARFIAQRWQSDGAGGFTYAEIPFPAGGAFVAANIDSAVATTFDVFGLNRYAVNQFGEAAVNLDALLPTFGTCFGITTVFVRTKASASADASLADFIEPFQLNFCIDDDAPQLTCPADVTVSCAASILPGNAGFADALDNCGLPAISYTDSVAPGWCGQEYTVYRKWTAVDACGNSTECTQLITVVDDTTPQILSGPGSVTVQCAGDVPPPDTSLLSARDECGNVAIIHVGDVSNGMACPETITRTYRAEDGCGHSADFVQFITIDDTTPPEVAGPADISVQCIENVPAPDAGLISASDNCGPAEAAFVEDRSDGNSCPEVITRVYEASDRCGNITPFIQTITIADDTPPEILAGPEDISVQCAAQIPAPDAGLISAADNCGPAEAAFVEDRSDGNSCPETITR